MRFGVPMQRERDRVKRRASDELLGRLSEQRLVAAADTVAGVRAFEVVNVGGVDVKPFLDKTDGERIVEADAFDDGVVETASLATTAIRPGAPATNAADVTINGLNALGGSTSAPGATEVVSATFDVTVAGEVIIKLLAAFEATNAETCEMALLIDDPGTKSMDDIRGVASARFRLLEVNDPGGDASSMVQIVSAQVLAAGTHTARLVAMARLDPSEFSVPAGSASIEVYVR